jgi:hypothetical protein
MIDFGFKAVIGAVSPTEVFRVDQAVVGLFLSPAALGLYVVGVAFTNLPKFFAQGIGQVAYPTVASKGSRQEGLSTAMRFMLIGLAVVTAVVVPIAVFSTTLVRFFFGPDFAGAALVTRVLLIAALIYSARRILSDCFQGLGAPKVGSLGEVATWVGLAVTLPLLLHRGIDGVAWSLVLASTVGLLVAAIAGTIELVSREARRVYAVRIRRAAGIVTMALCAAVAGSIVPLIPDLNVALVVALVAGSFFGVVVIACGPPRAGGLALYLATATMAWTKIRAAGWLTLSDVCLIVALALLASSLPAGRLRAATANPIARGSFLILLGGLIASFVSPNVLESVGNLAKFLFVTWAMLLAFILWKPAAMQIRRIVALWVISAATSAAVAISHASTPGTRPNGLAVHPNHLGLISVLALGPAFAFTVSGRRQWSALSWIAVAALLGGVVVSGSRASLLGATVVCIVALVRFGPRFRRIAVAVLLGTIFCFQTVGNVALPAQNAFHRTFGAQVASSEQSDLGRREALNSTVAEIASHPATGVGFSNALAAHDVYLQLLASGGPLALVGFLIIVGTSIAPLGRLARDRDVASDRLLHVALAASFAGFLVADMFQNALWDRFVWIIPVLLAAGFAPSISKHRPLSQEGPTCNPA